MFERSDELHRRVQAFAEDSVGGALKPAELHDGFVRLALEIARYQRERVPVIARLYQDAGPLESARDLRPLPADVFRFTRIAAHPEALDGARFHTSGTTSEETGLHALRRLDTYRRLSLASGKQALLRGESAPLTVLALAPAPEHSEHSSLGRMMQFFVEEWDLGGGSGQNWFLSQGKLELTALERRIEQAARTQSKVLLLATAFALVLLLDALKGRHLPLPIDSVIMPTGGTKGKTRSVEPEALRTAVAEAFAVPWTQVVHEYGMTELSSQLYEALRPGSPLAAEKAGVVDPENLRGLYFAPPWLEVTPVNPDTFEPALEGEVGLARFIDLGNVDSAVAILTADLIRKESGGVRLLGRRPGATLRGCSLPLETFLRGEKG